MQQQLLVCLLHNINGITSFARNIKRVKSEGDTIDCVSSLTEGQYGRLIDKVLYLSPF